MNPPMTQAMRDFEKALHDYAEHECDTARAKLVALHAAALEQIKTLDHTNNCLALDVQHWRNGYDKALARAEAAEKERDESRAMWREMVADNERLCALVFKRPAEPPVGVREAAQAFARRWAETMSSEKPMTDDFMSTVAALASRPTSEPVAWKLAMRVLQSDLYAQLDDTERAECDALIAWNPYASRPTGEKS